MSEAPLVKCAKDTDLKRAIEIGLDEAMTSLHEAIHDLSDEQVRAFPIEGRNNIAWIVMHTLDNLTIYTNVFQVGRRAFEREERWGYSSPHPTGDEAFPTCRELLDILCSIREIADEGLAPATEADLLGRRHCEDWWEGTAADAYMRTIFHTMSHVRQIWLLRGALGLTTPGDGWPRQHWA